MRKLIGLLLLSCTCFGEILAQTQTLEFYISQGLKNSPLLIDFQNQINSAAVDSLLVNAAQKPQVDANAQLMYAPVFGNQGYDNAITNGGNYSSAVSVSQIFLNRNILNNKYQGIRTQKLSLANQKKISENDLRRAITNQYLTSYADYSDLSFNETFLKLMLEEKNLLKTLVDHGVYKQTDFLSLLIETQTQEMLILQLEAQFKKDFRLLNQVCGINDTGKYTLNLPVINENAPVNLSLSPLLLQYKIDSLKIINDKWAVDLRYKPKFNWFADAGLMSSTPQNFYQHLGFSAGLNFSIPIYDGHQRKYETKKLDIQEDSRSSYQRFFITQYDQQMRQLTDELTSVRQLEVQLKKQANSATELISLAKSQLNMGNMPITEFINAVKNYLGINHTLNQTQIREVQIINEMNYLLQK
jgi:outer membrane protein TolC